MINKHRGTNATSSWDFSFSAFCSSGNIFFCRCSTCCTHHTMLQIQDREILSQKANQRKRKFAFGNKGMYCMKSLLKWVSVVWNSKTIQIYHCKEMLTGTECQTTNLETQGSWRTPQWKKPPSGRNLNLWCKLLTFRGLLSHLWRLKVLYFLV